MIKKSSSIKQWYIKFEEKEEGPFSIEELLNDKRFTKYTLVRKEGKSTWAPAHTYKEFKELFNTGPEEEIRGKKESLERGDILVDRSFVTPPYLDWLVLLLLLLLLWIIFIVFR